MATQFNFNGQLVKLPGAYTQVKSGITNPPLDLSYGNVLIIDIDNTNEFGGGAGINGELAEGKDSIYTFDNLRSFRSFIRGGKQWDISQPLFKPFGAGINGISNLHYVRALSTVAADTTIDLTGSSAGGEFTIQSKHEGLSGNGSITGTELTKGLGFIIEASPSDPSKFIVKFYRGTFTGNGADNIAYDGIAETSTTAELIATSDAFDNTDDLKAWMDIDFDFNNHFSLESYTKTSTGAVVTSDISAYTSLTAFSGGTQTFATSDLTAVLDAVAELDYTFVLAPDSGSDHSSATNNAILSHLVSDARFEKFMVVAGGDDKNTFTSESIAAAVAYDTDKVIVVHGGVKVASNATGTGLRDKSAEYKAAAAIGRIAGLEPQTPVTFKGLNYAAEQHRLNKNEKETALDNGVLATAFDGDINAFTVVQGVNSLQRNKNVVNADGTSHSIQLKRIAAQLNKEIEVNAKQQLLGNQGAGPNRSTISPAVVQEWLAAYLGRKTATATIDNLILGFQDISVEVIQDAYAVNYAFTPNFEINKLFFTGLIIDPNV
jgi:endonuclease YncB( thermonuclease family)